MSGYDTRSTKVYDCAWWDMDKDDEDIGRAMFDTVRDIEQRQYGIHEGNKRHARVYAGYLPNGLQSGNNATSNARAPFAATKNLVRTICDVGHAMIVKSRPRAAVVTSGADWQVQMQAQDLEQALEGAYIAGGLYQTAPRSFHDSTVFGTGGWKYIMSGAGQKFKLKYERFLIDDIVIDEEENRVDCFSPPNVYHRLVVRTDALVAKYAKGDGQKARDMRARLEATKNGGGQPWPGLHVGPNRSVLIEAHHVDPDNPADNRRVLSVDGIVLKSEKWIFPFQPYTFLWWALPITGFYGDGIAYRQFGRQERVTYMHRWIQTVLDRFAAPRAWIDTMGGPPNMHLSNDIGAVIQARGKVSFQTQELITGEIWHWLNKLEMDGLEDEGMNPSVMAGEPPKGTESAPAIREATFRQGQRFYPVSERWEHAIAVETAIKTTAIFKHHVESGSKPSVRWADRKLMYAMEWPELDGNEYIIRPDAASLDSLSPSARMQSALELAQTGWIDKDEGRALVAHPDLRESDDLDNAPTTYAKMVLRRLWRGEVVPVDERAELVTLMRIVKQGRLLAIERGVEKGAPDVLMNMNDFIDELDNAMKQAQQAAMVEAMQQSQMQQAAAAPPVPGMSYPAAYGAKPLGVGEHK